MPLELCVCDRSALREVDDDLGDQVAQVESAIEAVGKSGQVVVGIFHVLQRVRRASERGLEVAGVSHFEAHFQSVQGIGMGLHFARRPLKFASQALHLDASILIGIEHRGQLAFREVVGPALGLVVAS